MLESLAHTLQSPLDDRFATPMTNVPGNVIGASLTSSLLRRSAALFSALFLFAQPLSAQGLASLDTIVPALMKRYDVPGAALAVVRGNKVLALKGFGIARTRDNARVDSARTLFRLGSIGNLFVATV